MLSDLRARDAKDAALAAVEGGVVSLSSHGSEAGARAEAASLVAAAMAGFDSALVAPDPPLRAEVLARAEATARAGLEACLAGLLSAAASRVAGLGGGSASLRASREAAEREWGAGSAALAQWHSLVVDRVADEWLPALEEEAERRGREAERAAAEAGARERRLAEEASLLADQHAAERDAFREEARVEGEREVEALRLAVAQREEEREAQAARIALLEGRVVDLSVRAEEGRRPDRPEEEGGGERSRPPSPPLPLPAPPSAGCEEALSAALAAKAEAEARLRSEARAAKDRLSEAEARCEVAERRVLEAGESFERTRASLEEQIVRLDRRSKEQLRALRSEVASAEARSAASGAAEEEARRAVSGLEAERERLSSQRDAAVRRCEEAEARVHSHVAAQIQASRQREEALLSVSDQRMQERIASASAEKENVSRIASLEAELRFARKRAADGDEAERDARQMRQKTKEAEAELVRLACERDFETRRKEELSREREELRSENTVLHSELGALRRERDLIAGLSGSAPPPP